MFMTLGYYKYCSHVLKVPQFLSVVCKRSKTRKICAVPCRAEQTACDGVRCSGREVGLSRQPILRDN